MLALRKGLGRLGTTKRVVEATRGASWRQLYQIPAAPIRQPVPFIPSRQPNTPLSLGQHPQSLSSPLSAVGIGLALALGTATWGYCATQKEQQPPAPALSNAIQTRNVCTLKQLEEQGADVQAFTQGVLKVLNTLQMAHESPVQYQYRREQAIQTLAFLLESQSPGAQRAIEPIVLNAARKNNKDAIQLIKTMGYSGEPTLERALAQGRLADAKSLLDCGVLGDRVIARLAARGDFAAVQQLLDLGVTANQGLRVAITRVLHPSNQTTQAEIKAHLRALSFFLERTSAQEQAQHPALHERSAELNALAQDSGTLTEHFTKKAILPASLMMSSLRPASPITRAKTNLTNLFNAPCHAPPTEIPFLQAWRLP